MNKKTVEVRGVKIGEGIPKIIVPIVGKTKEEILAAAVSFRNVKLDLVEWRADWYEDVLDFSKAEDTCRALRKTLGNIPILFTFRTAREGGEKEIEPDSYAKLNLTIASSGLVDLIDVEAFTGDEIVKKIIDGAHKHNVKVVGSNHDFGRTPDRDELVRRLRKMQDLGADIPKIAVMPQNRKDVLTLLSATEEMADTYADRPIITMSMGGTGLISRLCGEVFGSAATFGAVREVSAPGQINAGDLDTVLEVIHHYTEEDGKGTTDASSAKDKGDDRRAMADEEQLSAIRAKIDACDDKIIEALTERMVHVQEITSYKKAAGIPILQPEQEEKQEKELEKKLKDNKFEEEILDIFRYIEKNSRKVQSKALFDYNIFLVGFMGAGKSTVAGELTRKLEMHRVEMDQMIAEKQGMSISEIFDTYGETYFRNLESNCLIELQHVKQSVVSCGGGIVMREDNAGNMKKNGRVVLLTATPETILERVRDSNDRPILEHHKNVEFISKLMDKRKEKYEKIADVTVETDGKSVDEICDEIIAKLIRFDNEREKQAEL